MCLSSLAQDAEFWYEHRLKQMTLDQKIGQLFMVAAYTNKDEKHVSEIENLIINYHIGGLIFFQNDPVKQLWLTNYYQSLANTPLMLGIDGEWGLAMRLQNTQRFPYALTLGALQNDSLVYEVGAAIGKQCKRLGIHINFAPDADINVNMDNPIIGFRAFGDNKYNVARKSIAYSNGLMSQNVLSCAKHFPGHGDVNTDSHIGLPVVDKTLTELDSLELYPFKKLIETGVPSVMVAHIHFPKLDSRSNRSASLSKTIIDTVLRQHLKFEGLIFTDAMNMKGVASYYQPGYADLEAIKAGNDVLLFSENVPVAFDLIKASVLNGTLTEAEIDRRVLKILKWKQFAGLDHYEPLSSQNLLEDLAGSENKTLLQNIANETVSTVKNGQLSLPIKHKEKVLYLALGANDHTQWKMRCMQEHGAAYRQIAKSPDNSKITNLQNLAKGYDKVVISFHQPKVWAQSNGGYTGADFRMVSAMSKIKPTVVVGFCNPYILNRFVQPVTVIAAYEDNEYFQNAAFDVLHGKIKSKGKLPVSLRLHTDSIGLGATVKQHDLHNIDHIVSQLIEKKGAPGCRVLVLKDGNEIFNKSYGYLNYDKKKKVNDSTVYDIASITKIAATTLAVMKLYEEGKLDIEKPLGTYCDRAKGSNKEHLIIKDILQHRAGLTAWIPFYKETLPYIDSIYCAKNDSAFCIKVADKLFMLRANKDTIYKRIFDSPLESKTYRYSDLSMILMQLVVEQVSGLPLDVYVSQTFYEPMGLKSIGFNPWKRGNTDNIAPTQEDRLFRKQELCGYVHDPAAAMLGGVSGHAGIFSSIGDLGKLMQMLNDGGIYEGTQYLKSETIQKFTAYQRSDSRRGLGFDKPDFSGKTSPASTMGSKLMFGHTGFTGTCVWVDPQYDLVFVFLSNRICPDEENKELINGNYRTKIQDSIYKAIGVN
ncbi:MAG: glycoside hydrolase family 3 N-terminal domain-containing protein [Chitinophagaceae bacterium]